MKEALKRQTFKWINFNIQAWAEHYQNTLWIRELRQEIEDLALKEKLIQQEERRQRKYFANLAKKQDIKRQQEEVEALNSFRSTQKKDYFTWNASPFGTAFNFDEPREHYKTLSPAPSSEWLDNFALSIERFKNFNFAEKPFLYCVDDGFVDDYDIIDF